ncbi:MAG: DUF4081 domain-containing protein, partial [Sciscionella sp.]|nr:DUF4081 domain-containing protein [Sciscionella sp.]
MLKLGRVGRTDPALDDSTRSSRLRGKPVGRARLLDNRDLDQVRAALAIDSVSSCMVASRVELTGLHPLRLGGEMWGYEARAARGRALAGLCFSGPNLVPVLGDDAAMRSFAERALRHPRACSSLVGAADNVLRLWERLADEWGPAREVRADQPLLAMDTAPAIRQDPCVRQVRTDELDRYLPAAI